MNNEEKHNKRIKSVSFDFTNGISKEKIGKIEITFNNSIDQSTFVEGVKYLHNSGHNISNVNYIYKNEKSNNEK